MSGTGEKKIKGWSVLAPNHCWATTCPGGRICVLRELFLPSSAAQSLKAMQQRTEQCLLRALLSSSALSPPLPFAPRRFLFAAHHHQPLSFLSPSPTERTPLHAPRSDERSRSLPFSPPNPALGAARRRVPNPQRCAKEVPPPFLRVVFFSSSFARG